MIVCHDELTQTLPPSPANTATHHNLVSLIRLSRMYIHKACRQAYSVKLLTNECQLIRELSVWENKKKKTQEE